MKYEKPEVAAVACAVTAVQGSTNKPANIHLEQTGQYMPTSPAYEADE